MNLQLKSFLDLLNINNIKYWVDSGTLLGLVREGDVLQNDNDIDIGMHANDLNKINHIKPQIRKLGYKIRSEFYNGKRCKYKFSSKDINNSLFIDMNIYRTKNNEFLWCPLTYFIKPKSYLFKSFQKVVKFFWRRVFNIIETNKFPYSVVKKTYTWVIPYEYYRHLIYNEECLCYMFREHEKYLNYRYGDWKIPINKWDTFKDDGGVVYKTPEKLI